MEDTSQGASQNGQELPISADEARNQGTTHFQAGRFNEALKLYEHAISLDEQNVLAISNAAETCLRLGKSREALDYAGRAFALDPSHKKSWLRYVKALSTLYRASEAFVWIAELLASDVAGGVVDDSILDLFAAAAKASPVCTTFFRGLYLERDPDHGGYRVRTAVPIKQRTTLSDEDIAVPWDNKCLFNDKRFEGVMKSMVDGGPELYERINGIHPRTFEEIPSAKVKSLADAEDKIRKHCGSSLPTRRLRNYMRALAVAKISGHHNGIYHFGAFYNHSCAPDCEIATQVHRKNLKVVAMRDIEAGAEVHVTYLNVDFSDGIGALHLLDMPIVCRKLSMERGFGVPCFCKRCNEELAAAKAKGQSEEDHGEAAFVGFQRALPSMMNTDERVLTFWKDSLLNGEDTVQSNWRDVQWKETFLLSNYAKRLEDHVEELKTKCPVKSGYGKQDDMMKYLEDMHAEFVKYDSLRNLIRLLEIKHMYLREGSFSHQPVYKVLLEVIKIHMALKRIPRDQYNEADFMKLFHNVSTALKLSEDLIT